MDEMTNGLPSYQELVAELGPVPWGNEDEEPGGMPALTPQPPLPCAGEGETLEEDDSRFFPTDMDIPYELVPGPDSEAYQPPASRTETAYGESLDEAERDRYTLVDAALDVRGEIRLLRAVTSHLAGDIDRNGKEIVSVLGALVRYLPLHERFTHYQRVAWEADVEAARRHEELELRRLREAEQSRERHIREEIERGTFDWLRKIDADETGEVRDRLEHTWTVLAVKRQEEQERKRVEAEEAAADRDQAFHRWVEENDRRVKEEEEERERQKEIEKQHAWERAHGYREGKYLSEPPYR